VSRYYAIGERRRGRVWGFAGWLSRLFIHLAFLTGFKNRVSALFHWTISFSGRSRLERTITAQPDITLTETNASRRFRGWTRRAPDGRRPKRRKRFLRTRVSSGATTKMPILQALLKTGATGLEPATSGVTGRRSNQLNYAPADGPV
jgi:hypothetical protein